MKVISIWQPWASLLVHGHKVIETRGWPAPASVVGTRIGIAATKQLKVEQHNAVADPIFQHHYLTTGLSPLEELPRGCILGTVLLHSCDRIDQDLMDDLTAQELAFGWFEPARYAWRIRNPIPFPHPAIVRGQQGIWDWNPHEALHIPGQDDVGQKGPPDLRGDL